MIVQLGMYCSSEILIGLMGACFLLGIAFGCFTLARLADVIGRKPILISSMIVLNICLFTIIFLENA